jgi:hypothetical protein
LPATVLSAVFRVNAFLIQSVNGCAPSAALFFCGGRHLLFRPSPSR